MTGRSVGSDASRLSCFLFRSRKTCEKRRKRSYTNVSNTSATQTSRVSQTPLQTPLPYFHQWVYYTVKNGLGSIVYKRPTFAFTPKIEYAPASLKESHTAPYTPKHRASLLPLRCVFHSPLSHLGKERPEKADARLRRVSASSGVAAQLGCVTFFLFC